LTVVELRHPGLDPGMIGSAKRSERGASRRRAPWLPRPASPRSPVSSRHRNHPVRVYSSGFPDIDPTTARTGLPAARDRLTTPERAFPYPDCASIFPSPVRTRSAARRESSNRVASSTTSIPLRSSARQNARSPAPSPRPRRSRRCLDVDPGGFPDAAPVVLQRGIEQRDVRWRSPLLRTEHGRRPFRAGQGVGGHRTPRSR